MTMGKLKSAWKRWREERAKEKAERPFRLSITSIHGCFPILSDEELEYMWALIEEYKKRKGLTGP